MLVDFGIRHDPTVPNPEGACPMSKIKVPKNKSTCKKKYKNNQGSPLACFSLFPGEWWKRSRRIQCSAPWATSSPLPLICIKFKKHT